MPKQSTNSKIVNVFDHFKFSYEEVHICEGYGIVWVISYQKITSDKCQVFRNNFLPIREKYKVKQQEIINF